MAEREKRLDPETLIVPVAYIDAFTIEARLVLARPVVIRWVILQTDRESGLAIKRQQLGLDQSMKRRQVNHRKLATWVCKTKKHIR